VIYFRNIRRLFPTIDEYSGMPELGVWTPPRTRRIRFTQLHAFERIKASVAVMRIFFPMRSIAHTIIPHRSDCCGEFVGPAQACYCPNVCLSRGEGNSD
jgi:hypothetical protein